MNRITPAAIQKAGEKLLMDKADIITAKNNIALFRAFCTQAIHHKLVGGYSLYGGRAIMEHLRWHTNASDNSRMYKISNDITPKFCALSMEILPELKDFFRTHDNVKF